MIHFLEGQLIDKKPTSALLNVNGIGYHAVISLNGYEKLPEVNSNCKLLTHLHVREDAHTLFGFSDETERSLFLLLISVSGIGPKLALAVLSGLRSEELIQAIASEDSPRLNSISGIGKKTAERMIIELKDKVAKDFSATGVSASSKNPTLHEAEMALISLGIKPADAQKRLSKIPEDTIKSASTEEIIRIALG